MFRVLCLLGCLRFGLGLGVSGLVFAIQGCDTARGPGPCRANNLGTAGPLLRFPFQGS